MLVEVKSNQPKLAAQEKQLKKDAQKIQALTSDVAKAEKLRDQARSELKSAKQRISPDNKRWLCNAFKVLHTDPSQCSDEGKGGVWVFVDENGRTSRYMEPTQADFDRAATAQKNLDDAELDLRVRKARRVDAEENLKKESAEFETKNAELKKNVAQLENKEQLVKSMKAAYEEAALKSGKSDPEMTKAFDKMADMIGKQKGECVELVKTFAGVGATGTWTGETKTVKDSALIPFAPAATFVDKDGEKKYLSEYTGNHAVIVLDKTADGLLVFEQSRKKNAGIRLMEYRGGTAANQAKIDKGEAEAKAEGITLENNKEKYYQFKYKYYHPSNDADNFSYFKK
jgi:hypothetical protein